MERTFWKSLTIQPPIYGADTPCSLFDEKISNGWSLRNLDDLLSTRNMPEIPGVTSPMTYFGMWKVCPPLLLLLLDLLYTVQAIQSGGPIQGPIATLRKTGMPTQCCHELIALNSLESGMGGILGATAHHLRPLTRALLRSVQQRHEH